MSVTYPSRDDFPREAELGAHAIAADTGVLYVYGPTTWLAKAAFPDRGQREGSTLRALVQGVLCGAMLETARSRSLHVDVLQSMDGDGYYEPWFFVTGQESGTRVRVLVEDVD